MAEASRVKQGLRSLSVAACITAHGSAAWQLDFRLVVLASSEQVFTALSGFFFFSEAPCPGKA